MISDKDIISIAKIRQALGVDEKVMLSELLDTAKKIRERAEMADLNTISVGRYDIYRRNGSLCLHFDSGVTLTVANEGAFEKVIEKFFLKLHAKSN